MCLVYLLEQALEEDPVVVDHVDVLGILGAPIRHLPQTFVQAGKVGRLVNTNIPPNSFPLLCDLHLSCRPR